jgi:hypothetical protein
VTFSAFWAIVLGFFALIGGFYTVVKFFDRVAAPKEKLCATVSRAPFEIPQSVKDEPQRVRDLTYAPNLAKILKERKVKELGVSDSVLNSIGYSISEYFSDELLRGLPDDIDGSDSLWTITVNNSGHKPCPEVHITIPGATLVSILREGKDKEWRKIKEIVSLETLLPGETISLKAWPRFVPWDARVRLSHGSGVGRIRKLELTPPLWHWMSDNWKFLCYVVPSMSLSIIGLALVIWHATHLDAPVTSTNSTAVLTNAVPSKSP